MICITCETKIQTDKAISKHDVHFCSEKCLEDYEKKLKELDSITDWDNCC